MVLRTKLGAPTKYTVQFEKATLREVRRLAKKHNTFTAEIIRTAVEEWVQRHRSGQQESAA